MFPGYPVGMSDASHADGGGVGGGPGQADYSAATGGALGFTRALAREAAAWNITVNAITPGLIATENATKDFVANKIDVDTFCANYPVPRAGRAEDIARAIVFFASDAASYITGETFTVSGGPILGGHGG